MRTLDWFTAREKYEPVHCKVSIYSYEVGALQLPIANLLIFLIYRMKTDTLIAHTQHTTSSITVCLGGHREQERLLKQIKAFHETITQAS